MHDSGRRKNGICRSIEFGFALALSCMSVLPAPIAEATQTRAPGSRRVALLIGIGDYLRADKLVPWTSNDVKRLEQTLQNRGGYEVYTIIDSARGDEALTRGTSTAENRLIQSKIARCLGGVGPTDSLLVFFTGHGFRDAKGNLYLAALDCDPANPVSGGVPISWLRDQIKLCSAQFKLLVIDACYAGSEKGPQTSGVTAKELGTPFEDLRDVVTLASSQENEKSSIWNEKGQSLFSYWLNQGLQGHANKDDELGVSVDELYDYVASNVKRVAEKHLMRQQNPVRIIGPRTGGVPLVIEPKPHTMKGLLQDMAEQLATNIQLTGLKAVGVPEFSVNQGTELGMDFGILGAYCAAELEGYLFEKSRGSFDIVGANTLQEAFQSKDLGPADLRTTKVKGLQVEGQGVPALVLGVLRSRTNHVITLQAQLRGTSHDNLLGRAGGTAQLNESEWGMVGHNVRVQRDDYRPEPPRVGVPQRPVTATLIERLEDRVENTPNPVLDSGSPHRVRIVVDDEPREFVVRGNDVFVALSQGESYEIWLENRETRPVFLRLLVDGLNTLPERPRTKAVSLERKEEESKVMYLPAQRVNLAEARAWQIDPATRDQKGRLVPQVNSVVGFHMGGSEYRRFQIVEAQNSVAARQKFAAQIGLITAAFYEAIPKEERGLRSRSRGNGHRGVRLGTGFGPEYEKLTAQYTGDLLPGRMVALWSIRYVSPATLEEIQAGN
jgi:hypothetical protein